MRIAKIITFLFLVTLPGLFLRAEVLTFDEIKRQLSGTKKPPKKKKRSVKKGKSEKLKKLEEELKESQKKLEAYRYISKLQSSGPVILKDLVVGDAEMIGAELASVVRASPQASTVTVTNLRGTRLPNDSKIECTVVARYKRACGTCSRLIIDGKSTPIKAELRNADGSSCVIGELSDDGEANLALIGITELARGALAVSQTSLPTLGGNIIEATASNKLKQGAINVATEGTELLRDKMRTMEPMVHIEQGKKVVIYFSKGVEL